jgi:threonine synthase
MGQLFEGVSASESATRQALARAFTVVGELVDPHTAVALAGADAAAPLSPTTPLVVLATAHPAKFPEAIADATGQTPPVPTAVAALAGLDERYDVLAADDGAIKAYVREFVQS